jgi:hypothetical protein
MPTDGDVVAVSEAGLLNWRWALLVRQAGFAY